MKGLEGKVGGFLGAECGMIHPGPVQTEMLRSTALVRRFGLTLKNGISGFSPNDPDGTFWPT